MRGYSAGCYKLLFVGQYTKDNGIEFKRIYKQKSIGGNGDMGGIVGFGNGATIQGCSTSSSTISLYVVKENRSAGGLIGTAYNNTHINESAAYSTEIKFLDNANISEEDLHPMMGIIVGQLDGSTIYHVGQSGCWFSVSGLDTKYKKNWLAKAYNQQEYVGTGVWGERGRTIGNCSVT